MKKIPFPTIGFRLTFALAVLAALSPVPFALAASDSWNRDLASGWATAANWSTGTAPGSTTTDNTDIATFGIALTGARIVTVDANRYIGGISFANSSTFGYTLATGTLHLNNGGVIQTLAGDGNHIDVISAPILIDGDGGSASFTGLATSGSSLMTISGTVAGVSTAGHTTTLNLNGTNPGGVSTAINSVTGVISDGGSGGQLAVVKSDSGAWLLNAANTFTGGLIIKSGTLTARVAGSLGGGGTGVVTLGDTTGSNGATLLGADAISYANPIVLATNASSGPLTIGNAYFGTGPGATFTGGVTGTNDLVIASNLSGGVSFTSGAVNNFGTITNSSTGTGNTVTISNVGSNVTAVVESSTAVSMTVTDLNVNSAGTTLTNTLGVKTLSVTNAVSGTGNLVINNNAGNANGINLVGGANNVGTVANSGTGTATETISSIGSNVTGVIENSITSALTVTTLNPRGAGLDTTLTNTAGLKLLTVTNAITGAGNLVINNNSASSNVIVLTAGANNTGTVTNSGTGVGGQTIGVIGSNVTGVTQNSTTSSLTLNGASTYAGATTISAGTLILSAAATINNTSGINLGTAGSQGSLNLSSKTASGFTLGSSQALSGYGNILFAGGKTLTLNGAVTPGTNGTGVIALTTLSGVGNISLTSSATVTMDLVDNTLAAGSGFDQISLNGALTYAGTLNLDVANGATLGVYHLFSFGTTETGTFSSINFSSGATGSFNYATGDLTLLTVPEPGTWALTSLGLGLALFRLRARGWRQA